MSYNQLSGDKYAFISSWMSDNYNDSKSIPFVPYMINLPNNKDDLRYRLNIPLDAIVLGRYGDEYTFDIDFVYDAINVILIDNPKIYFLFSNTKKFTNDHERIIHIDAVFDDEKVKFINTCDAMIHAKRRGELFGITIGEFSTLNKPIITYGNSPERMHNNILGYKGIYYSNYYDLMEIFHNISNIIRIHDDWNCYKEYTPEKVMRKFEEVFLLDYKLIKRSREEQINYINSVLDIYCINLKRSEDRWKHCEDEFRKYGLTVKRFDAIDGKTISKKELIDKKIITHTNDIDNNDKGALGIIASSVKLWEEISHNITDKWTLILEDDIKFHPNFLELFETYWKSVPNDADIILFTYNYPLSQDPYDEKILDNVSTDINEYIIKLFSGVVVNMAYAINRKSAIKLLSKYIPLNRAVDYFPPDKFNIYGFRRPKNMSKELIDDLYVDKLIWDNKYDVILYGLIGTRNEESTIGHYKYK